MESKNENKEKIEEFLLFGDYNDNKNNNDKSIGLYYSVSK